MNNLLAAVSIGDTLNSPWGKSLGFGSLVSLVLKLGLVVSGLIIMFLFVFGGIQIISGAGNSDPKQAAAGQQAINSAVVGFIIVFVAFWIVRLIEVITKVNFISNPNF